MEYRCMRPEEPIAGVGFLEMGQLSPLPTGKGVRRALYTPHGERTGVPAAQRSFYSSRNHTTTRIRIQTAGLAFGGTGLCSCRVGGVDGSCARHLTVESYMDIYASNSYTYYY